MVYNETNYTALFTDPVIQFNQTLLGLTVENGNGTLQNGMVYSFCRVEGFDLFMQMQVAQTVALYVILFLVSLYVSMYFYRFMTGD